MVHYVRLTLSLRINALKPSQATSLVGVELKTDVSEISVCIIRVDVVNDNVPLIFTPICQIHAS